MQVGPEKDTDREGGNRDTDDKILGTDRGGDGVLARTKRFALAGYLGLLFLVVNTGKFTLKGMSSQNQGLVDIRLKRWVLA